MPERTSLLPLVVLGCVGAIALFAYVLQSNIARLAEPVAEEKTQPTLLPAAGVAPSAQVPVQRQTPAPAAATPPPAAATPAPTVAPAPAVAAPAQPPKPVVVQKPFVPSASTQQPPGAPIAQPPGAPIAQPPITQTPAPAASLPSPVASTPAPAPAATAAPPASTGEPEVRAAIPKNKANQLTVNDADALIELGQVPNGEMPADVQEEENSGAGELVAIEPKRKVQIVVRRDGPDGKVEFQDVLHPRAHGLKLPPGKWFIQVPEPDAVEITRRGVAVPYQGAGVLVE